MFVKFVDGTVIDTDCISGISPIETKTTTSISGISPPKITKTHVSFTVDMKSGKEYEIVFWIDHFGTTEGAIYSLEASRQELIEFWTNGQETPKPLMDRE